MNFPKTPITLQKTKIDKETFYNKEVALSDFFFIYKSLFFDKGYSFLHKNTVFYIFSKFSTQKVVIKYGHKPTGGLK